MAGAAVKDIPRGKKEDFKCLNLPNLCPYSAISSCGLGKVNVAPPRIYRYVFFINVFFAFRLEGRMGELRQTWRSEVNGGKRVERESEWQNLGIKNIK